MKQQYVHSGSYTAGKITVERWEVINTFRGLRLLSSMYIFLPLSMSRLSGSGVCACGCVSQYVRVFLRETGSSSRWEVVMVTAGRWNAVNISISQSTTLKHTLILLVFWEKGQNMPGDSKRQRGVGSKCGSGLRWILFFFPFCSFEYWTFRNLNKAWNFNNRKL